ncbi:hypothetical protein GCWU000341_02931 [Oribacterium sp. oral taxon 078 str. F0262]|nr:hypothetical protein GCWU000341_02931 [Oribacterium sp. oral taxon 078 str. F0262]
MKLLPKRSSAAAFRAIRALSTAESGKSQETYLHDDARIWHGRLLSAGRQLYYYT